MESSFERIFTLTEFAFEHRMFENGQLSDNVGS
ncbi:hypothetical protein B1M_10993 [Burkholderia sp. TJI49]|nr:hypothetical protein B1M_10993 [Burkholderia sp. TJI49]